MKEIRYETSIIELSKEKLGDSIFLAGPTVRGHQIHLQPSWRYAACDLLRKYGFTGSVVIPEFTDITTPDKGNEDWIVPWENAGLVNCSRIIFWIPRTKELIGLNTNFEFGLHLGKHKDKLIYGRPENAYRTKYTDIMWGIETGKKIYNSLDLTCAATVLSFRE